jgi:NAD+ synthase
MELKKYLDEIVTFLKEYKEQAHADGYILGVSGGIDSAVCAFLIKKACGDNCLGLILPCYSQEEDAFDAALVCQAANLDFKTVSLNETYDEIYKSIISSFKVENSSSKVEMALANTKVRLRMTTLYAVGQMKNYLVVGTDNMGEHYTGYFTKHGDGACDVLPLVQLTKGEVFEAGRILGVPERVLNRRPTAGLIANTYDEDELGVSYPELDAFLLGNPIDPKKEERIAILHRNSEHKRKPAATPKEFKR